MGESTNLHRRVLTIGHSNHSLEHFLDLLKIHSVQVVVDTRSYPYSEYAPHFNRELLKQNLIEAGFKYVDLGPELGGRPKGNKFYDSKGHVFYDKVAETNKFQQGLSRLEKGIRKYTVAILCSEENPATCHRRLLVGKVLIERGIAIEHIRGDGRIQTDAEVSPSTTAPNIQPPLFPEEKSPAWKSIPSVLRRRRQSNSSAL